MSVSITFELTDRDLEHFIDLAQKALAAVASRPDAVEYYAAATHTVFDKVKQTKLPDFIAERLTQLDILANMVTDKEWQLPKDELDRVLSAMAYFTNPEDLIPDRIPGIGFLDDAIMAELVIKDLEPEISAYQEFCAYRTAEEQRCANQGLPTDIDREDWLADKRAVMHHRMRERRKQRGASSGWRVSLW